jgi:hypothetical protein
MVLSSRLVPAIFASLASLALSATDARADGSPCGPRLVELLGARAQHVFAPNAKAVGALVTLPDGADPRALGLEPFVPGFARLHASPEGLVAYAAAHPDLAIEVAPPLHPLLDQAGMWIQSNIAHEQGFDGAGALVGVADTGLDVTLPDFRDPKSGASRVAWILDLALPPAGLYPELESEFCGKDTSGNCVTGAVLQGKDIDAILAGQARGNLPQDEAGHGTHVTSIAAGNGGPEAKYVGAAPGAQIVFARVTRDSSESIDTDDVLTGISFLFNRADAMGLPLAANLSIGSDFGPHDGSSSWEKALAGFVGENAPGHALLVAAGNSGSIAYTGGTSPIHQTAHVTEGATLSVPILTSGSQNGDGEVDVWVTITAGSTLSVGLDGPDGTWIAPVPNGQDGSSVTGDYTAGIANGSTAPGSQVPTGSRGAVVIWTGQWPAGTYSITLQGEGTASLWLQSSGALAPDGSPVGFAYGVREGTINLPATQPGLIGVGCTVNRTKWTPIYAASYPGGNDGGLAIKMTDSPSLDDAGGLAVDGGANGGVPFLEGEVCWFSSAGPNVLGVPKPEISAPGAWVVAAMSSQAPPTSPESIFQDSYCPPPAPGVPVDPRCLQVDAEHAVAEGTSMSAPMVTGAVALMLEKDRTLTEGQLVPILQGGAHYFRSIRNIRTDFVEFEDQGGPGELDIIGSFAVMDQMSDPALTLPSANDSWITLSTDYLLADGSTPTIAIIELRTADKHAADLFAPSRLAPLVKIDGQSVEPPPVVVRRGPGVWFYSLLPRPGFGGQSITFGATFDGEPIVTPRTIPIATDPWTATYPSEATGGCSIAGGVRRRGSPDAPSWTAWASGFALLAAVRRRARARAPARPRASFRGRSSRSLSDEPGQDTKRVLGQRTACGLCARSARIGRHDEDQVGHERRCVDGGSLGCIADLHSGDVLPSQRPKPRSTSRLQSPSGGSRGPDAIGSGVGFRGGEKRRACHHRP